MWTNKYRKKEHTREVKKRLEAPTEKKNDVYEKK